MQIITSLQNPLVKSWRALNKSRAARKEQGLFLAEGEHMTGEALRENSASALVVRQDAQEKYAGLIQMAAGLPCYCVSETVMAALSDAKTPQGILALCAYPDEEAPARGDWLVALEGVQDPGNVGTILRTMDAAGFDCLLMDEKTADPYAPKTLRASMGSVFRVPSRRCADLPGTLDRLAAQGYAILAGDLKGEPLFDRGPVGEKICILIGNEGAGLSPGLLAKATLRIRIPMAGRAESLNAAVAAGILMYDVFREKSKA